MTHADPSITRNRRHSAGFSLIELLIVVVLMGVMATVGVFALKNLSKNSDTNACTVEVKKVNAAIQAYYADQKVWITTGTLSALVPSLLTEVPSTKTPSGGGTVDASHVFKAAKC